MTEILVRLSLTWHTAFGDQPVTLFVHLRWLH